MQASRNQKRDVAGDVKGMIFKANEIDHDIKVKNQKLQTESKNLERLEPVYSTLQRIDQKCKEENIKGYYGLVANFVKCKADNFKPCVDMAAKSKLFGIVVDTLETASEVLKMNKAIKGSVVNILPLELYGQDI